MNRVYKKTSTELLYNYPQKLQLCARSGEEEI